MYEEIESRTYGSQRGSIEVICGSMFSGKTEELIRRIRRAQFAHQTIKIFKPSIDTRYSEVDVISHNQTSISCNPISKSRDIVNLVGSVDVIGIDEAQFFDLDIISVCKELANNGKRVIVAGLDMDFKGRPFGSMPDLMAIADDVYKVHAICVKCGNLAYISHRLVSNEKRVLLGEKEVYEPLCRKCYNDIERLEERE